MSNGVYWPFLLRHRAPIMTIRCSRPGLHPIGYPTTSSIGPMPVFKGYAPTILSVPSSNPRKKPPGKELNVLDRWCNTLRARIRIVVEHAIGGVKRFGAVAQIYRNRGADFEDRLTLVACGLWNWHLAQAR